MRGLLALMVLVAAGCSSAAGTTNDACGQGTDCVSGVCGGDGRCVDAGGAGGSGGEAGSGQGGEAGSGQGGEAGGGGEAGSGGGPAGGGGSGGSGSKVCSPDGDGNVTRQETPLLAGAKVTFRLAQKAPVSTAGKGPDVSSRVWDFSGEIAGDHSVLIETQPLDGKWFASKFPGASYALRLSDSEDLLGVFEATDNSLLLRGVVSPTDGLTRTELTYTPPVTVQSFPMKLGSSWTTQSTVTGLLSGVVSTYFENYQTKIDAAGTVKTPLGEFPALRLNLLLTRTVGVLVTTKRTFLFSSECYGTVAKIVSNDNDTGGEFSMASELSRIAP